MREEEEAEPSSNIHLIWDETKLHDINDDIIEEACVENSYNVWSKGAPKTNYSSSTLKMGSSKKTKITQRNPTTT